MQHRRRLGSGDIEGNSFANKMGGRMKNLFLLVMFLPTICCANQTSLEVAQYCVEILKDKQLDVLRTKMPILDANVTPNMLKNHSKPTPNEAKVIQLFLKKKIECYERMIGGNASLTEQKCTVHGNPYEMDAIIAYLMTGFITYSEYGKWLTAAQEAARKEKPRKESSLLFLTCRNEQPGDYFGAEIQFQIDLANQLASANRGPAQPSDVRVSNTEIVFRQGENSVSISRTSGRLDISSPGVGLIFAGQCQQIAKQQF